jgi:hypothetical protein
MHWPYQQARHDALRLDAEREIADENGEKVVK